MLWDSVAQGLCVSLNLNPDTRVLEKLRSAEKQMILTVMHYDEI